jgi:RimJ/RimL family protein N-acetyltransferase
LDDSHFDYSRYFWQGKQVRLRPLRTDDTEQSFISSLDSPSRQLLQLGIELPTSIELQKTALEKYAGCKDADGIIVFGIENLEGHYIGGISLHSRDKKNGRFSFGVVIDRQHRRQGYAEDAVEIILKYGFWERRYQKCNSACLDINKGSIKLHKKLGFLEEGRRRRQFFLGGEYRDEILFGLMREEFEKRIKG